MRLNFFAGCTEPIPINGIYQEEITCTMPVGNEWCSVIPPVNKWRVHHFINSRNKAVLTVEYFLYDEWHEAWFEHTQNKEWHNIWSMVRAVIAVSRESMPEVCDSPWG